MSAAAARVASGNSVFSPRTAIPVNFATTRHIVSSPHRQWRPVVIQRLNELCALAKGWDGYCAGPVNFETANFALQMLDTSCVADVPAPSIVPGPNGDLQVEWHLAAGDIELHVRSPLKVSAWHTSSQTDEDGTEVQLTNDFTIVARWLDSLLERNIASQATAA